MLPHASNCVLFVGLQQEAYTSLNWEAKLTTRTVRATPLTVVVAPSQSLDWDLEGRGGQLVGKPPVMLKLSRVFAVIKGLIAALTGRGGSFALLIDCHFEVDEDFQIVDLDTVGFTLPSQTNRCRIIVCTMVATVVRATLPTSSPV